MPEHRKNSQIWRILDANTNRASEGLRAIEEYVRLVVEDTYLQSRVKTMRHSLTELMQSESLRFLQARDSTGDVGQSVETDGEHTRQDFQALLLANFKRVQQSLRSLEEYSKLLEFPVSRNLEKLRFDSYALEKSILNLLRAQRRWDTPAIYVLIHEQESAYQFSRLVKELVAAHVDAIQIRHRKLNDRDLMERARLLVDLTKDSNCHSIINNRPDIAALTGATGVHLGQDDLSVREARRVLEKDQWIGVSTHSLRQALAAVDDGADYIGIGPVFPSTTKSFDEFIGVDTVQSVICNTKLPTFAIGGIGESNAHEIRATGCQRIAISGALTNSNDPGQTIDCLRNALGKSEAPATKT